MIHNNHYRMAFILALVGCAIVSTVALASGNSFIIGDLRVDLPVVYNAHDYRVHLYANPGWKHTVIVDKIDGDTCNGNNVSVAAHANDRYQHPLSEYSVFQWYPVEMKGYFDYKRIAFLPFVLNSSMSLTESWTQNPYPAPEDMNNLIVVTPTPNPYPAP